MACRYKQPMNCTVNSGMLPKREMPGGLKLRFFSLSICIIVIIPVRISQLYYCEKSYKKNYTIVATKPRNNRYNYLADSVHSAGLRYLGALG